MNFSLWHKKRSGFENILSVFTREISLDTFEYNICYFLFWALFISITLGLVEAISWKARRNGLKIQWHPQRTKWRWGIKEESIVRNKIDVIDPGLFNNVVIYSEASQNQWWGGQNESLGKEKEMDFSFFSSMLYENINSIDKLKKLCSEHTVREK